MGSLTFTVVGGANVGTKTKSYSVADVDIDRLVTWAQAVYATPAIPAPTVTQALLAWAESLMNGTHSNVLRWEKEQDVTAVPEPDPFNAT